MKDELAMFLGLVVSKLLTRDKGLNVSVRIAEYDENLDTVCITAEKSIWGAYESIIGSIEMILHRDIVALDGVFLEERAEQTTVNILDRLQEEIERLMLERGLK